MYNTSKDVQIDCYISYAETKRGTMKSTMDSLKDIFGGTQNTGVPGRTRRTGLLTMIGVSCLTKVTVDT